jgi:hypothetical protein
MLKTTKIYFHLKFMENILNQLIQFFMKKVMPFPITIHYLNLKIKIILKSTQNSKKCKNRFIHQIVINYEDLLI